LWAVAGLGNPGRKYSRSRHNAGFMAVDALAQKHGIALKEYVDRKQGSGHIEGVEAVIIKPLTFMNRSGPAVCRLMKKLAIPMERLIVVHDDMDMPAGRLRIRKSGSPGGHKGVESIISSLGSREFIRVKLGIGRDPGMLAEDYVLGKFGRQELPLVKEAIDAAVEAIAAILSEGVEKAMNRFNRPRS